MMTFKIRITYIKKTMKNKNDLFHPVLAFAIVAIVGLALKGGPEFHNIVCALIGAAAAEVALFGKEFYDRVHKKTFFDWKDIKNGQYGVVLGFLCVWLLM